LGAPKPKRPPAGLASAGLAGAAATGLGATGAAGLAAMGFVGPEEGFIAMALAGAAGAAGVEGLGGAAKTGFLAAGGVVTWGGTRGRRGGGE
jgi:hypothetical protein